MSDVFTKLWLNIDEFNYKNIRVEYKDVELYSKAWKDFIIRPTSVFLLTYIFSTKTLEIMEFVKKFFIE